MAFPTLTTERLSLIELQQSDAEDLLEVFSDPKVVKFYDIEAFDSQAQAEKLIQFFADRFKQKSGIRWGIKLTATGELIGTCGFNTWNTKMHNASIGYELSSKYWKLGYAFEAVHKIIEAAYQGQLPFGDLYRIQADTMAGNQSSEYLLRKLGFNEEGIRRASGYWKNQYHDLKCYGLLKPEFK